MKFLPTLLIVGICLTACHKKDATPTIDFGPGSGITSRDANANPQGPPDPTDWTLDGNWNQQEQELFKELSLDLTAAALGGVSTAKVSVWPNPVGGDRIALQLESQAAVTHTFVVVDAQYKVVLPLLSSPAPSRSRQYAIGLSSDTFQQGRRYRLYYVLHDGQTLYYKGHGDIKIGL